MKESVGSFKKTNISPKILWLKIIPVILIFLMLMVAFCNFLKDYFFNANITDVITTNLYFTPQIFFIDFFVFFSLYFLAVLTLVFSKKFLSRLATFIISFMSISLFLYKPGDLFTIKVFVYSSWIFAVILVFPKKTNIILASLCGIFLFVLQFYFFLFPEQGFYISKISFSEYLAFGVSLCFVFVFSLLYVILVSKYVDLENIVEHLNLSVTQLTQINNDLQDLAKIRGDEATHNERMRITRDMHDSCGYVFVNIIAMMDAAASQKDFSKEQADDLFLSVRNLAQKGLKETRATLHAIRNMESPLASSINAIYDVKNIFSRVSGINIELSSGNIKKDYGRTVNSVIVHTMQEALTNSIRHGRAKNIAINLWEKDNVLIMTVQDDGVGTKEIVKGIGLSGMEERLTKTYGTLETSTPPEGGFKVTIKIPLINISLKEGDDNGET